MLHVCCGDDIFPKLKAAGIRGEFVRWADPLCQGPTPAGLSAEEWRSVRARFNAERYGLSFDEALSFLTEQDRKLQKFADHEEVVLWFEHDLFDQVILIYLLTRFSEQEPGRTRISLICIGEYPGVERFRGLGYLEVDQLRGLFGTQHPVTAEEFDLARRAWAAFCSPDPRELEQLLGGDTSALPFLEGALVRHLQEYPSSKNGLSRTEELALQVVATGVGHPGRIFAEVQEREPRPWLGDRMFWPVLKDLAGGPEPLLVIAGDEGWSMAAKPGLDVDVRITATGKAVLEGERDWIDIAGIDRWLGGVHLKAEWARWRWDDERGRLVEAGK